MEYDVVCYTGNILGKLPHHGPSTKLACEWGVPVDNSKTCMKRGGRLGGQRIWNVRMG